MKYVSRGACDGRGALGGVLKEVELLSSLEHPFLVNLWFSFQGKQTFSCVNFVFITQNCVESLHMCLMRGCGFVSKVLICTAKDIIILI